MAKRFFNWWLRLAYWAVLRLEVVGRERIPAEGPVILMINHVHFLDPFVVLASMPRPVTVLSKIENFSIPFWGLIFKWYGAIPVRRGQVDRRALRGALAALKAGTLLIVAPEGTRSPDGTLQPALNGMAYLAHREEAAIVPLAITGQTAFGRHLKRLRRTPVRLQLGQPFYVRADGRRLERDVLHAVTTEAMYQLAALLPPEQRGVYADLDQATTRYLHFVDDGAAGRSDESDGPRAAVGEEVYAAHANAALANTVHADRETVAGG